ncbi:MAG: 2-amino-4-hydroxy-6-hydroxymethyldihydropteridine diphosphokinase [Actinomycetales bacterium]|nr:MAG: 2-amino-4-hydroxy-6-hydroxymethyldihydropteridine diphosphokinase [Actinomycetales bacterium]
MKAIVALGANLDDPQSALELAIALLREATDVIALSSFYITKPVGGPVQPDYVNAVAIIESDLPALELLHLLQGIEKSMGRIRVEKWGPRVIDLDLISYGSILSQAEELTLPHPRAHERRFVLEPWLEIDPEAHLLTHGLVSEILQQLPPAK